MLFTTVLIKYVVFHMLCGQAFASSFSPSRSIIQYANGLAEKHLFYGEQVKPCEYSYLNIGKSVPKCYGAMLIESFRFPSTKRSRHIGRYVSCIYVSWPGGGGGVAGHGLLTFLSGITDSTLRYNAPLVRLILHAWCTV